jgi:hypothetical protein
VDDGVEAFQVLRSDIANVPGALLVAIRLRTKVAAVVPADIEAYDLVPSGVQKGNQYGTDISAVAIHQDPHDILSPPTSKMVSTPMDDVPRKLARSLPSKTPPGPIGSVWMSNVLSLGAEDRLFSRCGD